MSDAKHSVGTISSPKILDSSKEILSSITVFSKYAKYLPALERREVWDEIVTRNMNMHIKKFPKLEGEIRDTYKFVYNKQVLPSMRSMQFAGKPVEINPVRLFNCSFLHIDDYRAFSEVMFLLLSGTGVGYSVQFDHVEKLPVISKSYKTRRFLVNDSIEGWADAVKALMKAYFGLSSKPVFDFSDIRPKGAKLITSGGKAPGSGPLKECLFKIEQILENKNNGEKLTPLECHDILCYEANAVLAGGIRRAAMIALFSFDDEDMLSCKFGNWWELNEQRGRSNNSATILRDRVSEEEFKALWKKIELSGSGEPGFYFTNDENWGLNPCAEVSLRSNQFCNLTTINASDVESQEDLNARVKAAAFIGTLQASYTDFHYLRESWKRTTEKEALIGVSMTGIASKAVLGLNLKEAAEVVKVENERVAKILGINKAARTTVIKPEGTASCVLGTSSGIHAWHDEYYIRRMRVGKNEALYTYLSIHAPELLEDDYFKPHIQAVISIPQRAVPGSILRTETAMELLQRVQRFHKDWIKPGHRGGRNKNNVSATITIKNDEWEEVGNWCWEHKNDYTALSFLPHADHTYVQAPFESITQEKYERLYAKLKHIDFSKIIETDDSTDLSAEAACSGGACEITTV
jgi:ribonucleoside-triphosphate reductase